MIIIKRFDDLSPTAIIFFYANKILLPLLALISQSNAIKSSACLKSVSETTLFYARTHASNIILVNFR